MCSAVDTFQNELIELMRKSFDNLSIGEIVSVLEFEKIRIINLSLESERQLDAGKTTEENNGESGQS